MKQPKLTGVEVADYKGPGYKPMLQSDGDWMAALMNGTKTSWAVPGMIEQHLNTDELFVLVSGRALLIVAGQGKAPGAVHTVEMKKNVLYNVKARTWHATPMTPRARFVIIERTGTDWDASQSVHKLLSPSQKAGIRLGRRK